VLTIGQRPTNSRLDSRCFSVRGPECASLSWPLSLSIWPGRRRCGRRSTACEPNTDQSIAVLWTNTAADESPPSTYNKMKW